MRTRQPGAPSLSSDGFMPAPDLDTIVRDAALDGWRARALRWNLANALLPLWASVEVERAALARLPSAAAHLLELALVVALPAALLGAERRRAS